MQQQVPLVLAAQAGHLVLVALARRHTARWVVVTVLVVRQTDRHRQQRQPHLRLAARAAGRTEAQAEQLLLLLAVVV
jgi:hypothetical protein